MVNYKRMLKPRGITKISLLLTIFFICYFFGVFTHLFEKDLDDFNSSLANNNYELQVASQNLQHNDDIDAKFDDVNNLNFTFLHKSEQTCMATKLNDEKNLSTPYLVILIKSKYSNFKQREAIRKTWGKSDSKHLIRTVFLIGYPFISKQTSHRHLTKYLSNDEHSNKINNYIQQIEEESREYKDLIQQNFVDTYYNNTLKTSMAIKWINKYCSNSKFYLLIDDDFYLNPNLLMKYLINKVAPSMYNDFYAGFVFPSSSPMRHLLSKWYISLNEYPYDKFPPYVSAGCYILSKSSAQKFYLATKFTKLFKFDDIYMGILASRLNIKPIHIENIFYYPPKYYPSSYAHSVIASHGFQNEKLVSIWNQLEGSISFKSDKYNKNVF